jgi:hypothetical protein
MAIQVIVATRILIPISFLMDKLQFLSCSFTPSYSFKFCSLYDDIKKESNQILLLETAHTKFDPTNRFFGDLKLIRISAYDLVTGLW